MPIPERFRYDRTADVLEDALEEATVQPADDNGAFPLVLPNGTRAHLRMPTVFFPPSPGIDAREYLDELPSFLGLHVVVLLEAGAAALGVFDDGEAIHHKTLRKYVVRGNGKYQRKHLESKGKSRYGSRLRLRNAVRFFEEVGELLTDWAEEFGDFERVFSVGTRQVWAELFECRVPPPFGPEDPAWTRLEGGIRSVSHEEMLRTYRDLGYGGWVPDPSPADPGPGEPGGPASR